MAPRKGVPPARALTTDWAPEKVRLPPGSRLAAAVIVTVRALPSTAHAAPAPPRAAAVAASNTDAHETEAASAGALSATVTVRRSAPSDAETGIWQWRGLAAKGRGLVALCMWAWWGRPLLLTASINTRLHHPKPTLSRGAQMPGWVQRAAVTVRLAHV